MSNVLWTNSKIFIEDMEKILQEKYIPFEKLQNSTVFITGGTGLIGSSIISTLLYFVAIKKLNLKVVALVRDVDKAKTMFEEQLEDNMPLFFLEGSVEEIPEYSGNVDYIIHGASPTASAYFVNSPVETIKTVVNGTDNMLAFAVKKAVKSFTYLSSMEMYGSPTSEQILTEEAGCVINTMNPRSSYPEGKRICETLCASYCSEYKIHANVIRLAQTFGPGISANENRAFAEFMKCAINGNNIVLKTAGTSKHPYLYTTDAVSAILTVLLCGEAGKAYNAANPDTYCSIYEMANVVADIFGNGKVSVTIDLDADAAAKYPPANCLNMSVDKIMNLGWKPYRSLREMYIRMADSLGYKR